MKVACILSLSALILLKRNAVAEQDKTAMALFTPRKRRRVARSDVSAHMESPTLRSAGADLVEDARGISQNQAKLIKQLRAQIDDLKRNSAGNVYTAAFVRRTKAFERTYNVREVEFEVLVSTLRDAKRSKNFGLQLASYTLDDYAVWYLAYVTGAARSYDAISHSLSLGGVDIGAEQVRRKVEWVGRVGASALSKKCINFLSDATMKAESKHVLDGCEPLEALRGKRVFIIDGTAVNVYRPSDNRLRRFTYCYFKHAQQVRFQVITTLSGHVVHMSPYTEGHLGDSEALELDAKLGNESFYKKYEAAYREAAPPKKPTLDAYESFVLADKGYGKVRPPKSLAFCLTSSARGESTDGAQFILKDLRDKQIFTHDNIAEWRTLIERAFGRVLNTARWLVGPVWLSQKDLAYSTWQIFFAINNMQLSENLPIFGEDYHFNRTQ